MTSAGSMNFRIEEEVNDGTEMAPMIGGTCVVVGETLVMNGRAYVTKSLEAPLRALQVEEPASDFARPSTLTRGRCLHISIGVGIGS